MCSLVQGGRRCFIANLFMNNINLQIKPDIDISSWKVVGEKLRLERLSLIGKCFRHSPPYSTVTIDLEDDGNLFYSASMMRVRCTTDISKTYFKIFPKEGEIWQGWPWAFLCRITVENWGGSIGYSPHKPGGWFLRLPNQIH